MYELFDVSPNSRQDNKTLLWAESNTRQLHTRTRPVRESFFDFEIVFIMVWLDTHFRSTDSNTHRAYDFYGGKKMKSYTFQKGSALIICMVVLVVCSALAVGLAAISGANMEIAVNQRGANQAFASAESGLETIRYWLSRVTMPSSTLPGQYFTTAVAAVRSDLLANGITNMTLNSDGTIPSVTLDATTGRAFTGLLHWDPGTPHILEVTVRGSSGEMARTIKVDFSIEPYKFPIFDYGLATKGALNFPQNPTLTGAAENWEADL